MLNIFKHFRVDHSTNEFATGSRHINGIESFWSFAKRRLQKFNGVPAHTFYLHRTYAKDIQLAGFLSCWIRYSDSKPRLS